MIENIVVENKRGRKPGVKLTPDNETRAQKFNRLGNKRLKKAINTIRTIRNLAVPNYEYTQEQVDYIIKELQEAIDNVKVAFSQKPKIEMKKVELPQ